MSNLNIAAEIPIRGKGFVVKTNGNFQPGEYKRLNNVEVDDVTGNLINRRNIQATGGTTDATLMTNPYPFIGYMGNYTIIASKTSMRAVSATQNVTLWSPSSLPVPTGGGGHMVIGAFVYNNINYWLTLEYDPVAVTYRICAYYSAIADIANITFASLTRAVLITSIPNIPRIKNYFINKERLFIVTDSRTYWSKPTDPLTFAVPDGGFISIADRTINYGFVQGDITYLLSDNSIYAYSYSEDPNLDGYLRLISPTVGGEWGCVYRGDVFVINKTGIYRVSNLSLEKIHEGIFDNVTDNFESKIVAFEDYLVVVKRLTLQYNSIASNQDSYDFNLGKWYTSPGGGPIISNQLNVFFINMNNGATHAVDFQDQDDQLFQSYITDVVVNPNKDFSGNYALYIMTNKLVTQGPNYVFKSGTYIMNARRDPVVVDLVRNAAGTVIQRLRARLRVEIENFSPDGDRYLMKKFRHLMFMAKFPRLEFACDIVTEQGAAIKTAVPLINDAVIGTALPQGHWAAKVPINQRTRSITVKLYTINNSVNLSPGNYDYLEISDMRVLYTPTARAVTNRTELVSNSGTP